MKKALFVFTALLVSHLSFAQVVKLGYVYDDYIMMHYKEVKDLQNEVNTKREELSNQFQAKATLYQEKFALYQQSLKDISNITTESLNESLKEVQRLKGEAEEFQQKAEGELQSLIQMRYAGIRSKVDAAIKKVAAEKNYKLVFRRSPDGANRESTPIMLYSNDNGRDDLSDAVLIKLGSTPPPKPQTTSALTPKATAPAAKKPAPKKS